ncbi:MAG: hypothetical protein P4L53_00675 [Candidatus Obscuribacterales bacterium]|nr:hypothetical protein [Candidatus Obscuribacterales bacterium]
MVDQLITEDAKPKDPATEIQRLSPGAQLKLADAGKGTLGRQTSHETRIADNVKELSVPAIETDATRSVQKSTERLTADNHQNENLSAQQKSELDQSISKFLAVAKEKNLSADEISRTLDATSKLLEGKTDDDSSKALSAQDRAWLAESVMHNVANSQRVDQGFHNTCNITAISKRVMADDPARVAEMVSFVGLHGFYRAADGALIKLDSQSLKPDTEAAGGETEDNKRNYASQVFAVAAINNFWQRQFPPHQYIQHSPTGQGDTGERLINFTGKEEVGSDGKVLDHPNLDCRAMITIGRELGIKDNFLIANSKADAAAGALVDSADGLGKTLETMQNDGRLPAVIFVRTDNKLFTGAYNSGDTGGWHVITVDHYDAQTGNVHISNQWGQANDREVPLNLLYDATLPPALWEKSPGYMDRAQFERYHQYMADGGAGLDKNGVVSKTDMEIFLQRSRKELQEELPPEVVNKLATLHNRLEKAEAEQDSNTISLIMGEIDYLRQAWSGQGR